MVQDPLTEEQQAIILKIRKRVIEHIGINMDLYGLTQSAGHLYGLLFFTGKPMTLDEMGSEMKMSKTSMSTAVRSMLDLRMVNKIWEKGSRKDLYEVEYDWHQTFLDYFAIRWKKAVESNLLAIQKGIKEADKCIQETDNKTFKTVLERDKEKLLEAKAYYHWLDRLIETMESGEIFNLVPR
ncbi:transcriptional regulator [Paenibacillus yonginensis]|uniref:HTH-type transcriptional regulator n=1 Tax=Paenibacillus yonginensis TaxID=1462996 RepID=A0A1B1MW83_9BACL|nr:transcriptional regulator [Paenibacillus yonginensis]ANS73442.1 transcriptional regulator [Paenibacillus yonginensis]